MKTVRTNGTKTARLHTPEVRSLDDAAATLRSIAVRIDDKDEIAHLQNTAQILEATIEKYGPKQETAAPPAPPPAKKKVAAEPLLTE